MVAMLIGTRVVFGQLKPSTFEPFKFELQEDFSQINESVLPEEISEIVAVQRKMEQGDTWSIRYWNGSYAFLCEWSATAGAAHRIIKYYFPGKKERLDYQLSSFKSARLATGLQFPSDIEKGIEIGRKIADKYIE